MSQPWQAHEVRMSETVSVTLRWADGRIASIGGDDVIEGQATEVRALPPLSTVRD